MNIFVQHRFPRQYPKGFDVECYGPFKTVKGANTARDLIARINVNTGLYFDTVTVIRRKNQPVERTLTWDEWCATANVHTREEYGNLDK